MGPCEPVLALFVPETLRHPNEVRLCSLESGRENRAHPRNFCAMRIHSSSAAVLLYAATALYGQEVTTSTTGAVDVSESGNSTTTSIPLSEAAPVPIVEIVVVAVGVILLLFAAIKMTSLVRQYSAAGSTNNGSMSFQSRLFIFAQIWTLCRVQFVHSDRASRYKPTCLYVVPAIQRISSSARRENLRSVSVLRPRSLAEGSLCTESRTRFSR